MISHNLEINTRSCSTGHRNETLVSCRVEVEQTAENSFSAEFERGLPDFDAAVYVRIIAFRVAEGDHYRILLLLMK